MVVIPRVSAIGFELGLLSRALKLPTCMVGCVLFRSFLVTTLCSRFMIILLAYGLGLLPLRMVSEVMKIYKYSMFSN